MSVDQYFPLVYVHVHVVCFYTFILQASNLLSRWFIGFFGILYASSYIFDNGYEPFSYTCKMCLFYQKWCLFNYKIIYIHLSSSLWFIHFLLYSWFPLGLYYLKRLIWQMYQSILIDPDFNNSLNQYTK